MASSLSARIPRKLLDDGGPALAAHVAANLERLVADVLAAGRKTRAIELADALRLHADDPELARAAAELREFTGAGRVVVATGLVAAFARVAARGLLAEPDPATRLSTLERLVDWTMSSGEFDAAADVQELVVAERRAEGGSRLLRSMVHSVQLTSMAGRKGREAEPVRVTARVDEILDLAASLGADERLPVAQLLKAARSAVMAFQSALGKEAAVAPSARLVELVKDWCAPNDPELLPLVEQTFDDHISRLLALDRLDDAIGYSQQLLDRYGLLVVTLRVDPAHAAIVFDRHAHLLDRAERAEEALAVSERAIALGAKAAPHFPRLAGLLRFHSDRLLAVGRESEAIETAIRAVEAGEQADSPLETAFSLAHVVFTLANAGRDDEAIEWSRREVTAWKELFDEGVEIAARNYALAIMNRRAIVLRAGRHGEARKWAASAVELYRNAVSMGDSSVRPDFAESLLALCADMERLGEGNLETYSRQAIRAYEELEAEFPGHYGVELTMALDFHTRALENAGRPGDAVANALRGLAILEEHVGEDLEERRALAGAVADCARLLITSGDIDAGLEHSARAVSLFENLAAADPAAYGETARFVKQNHTNFLSGGGRFDEALAHVRRSLAERAVLAAEDRVRHLALLAAAHDDEAHHLHMAGRVEEALAAADNALRAWREAGELNPEVRRAVAGAVGWHAELRAELGDPVRAAELADEAARLVADLPDEADDQPDQRSSFPYRPEGLGSSPNEP